MKYEDLRILKNKLDYLLTHNKNYTKQQYYALIDIDDMITKELNKTTKSKNFIKSYIKDYILNDNDFKKCFESNYKHYNKGNLTFKQYTNFIVNTIFEEYTKSDIYLDKTYLDISYLIINDKIINLDFIYEIFKDYMKD